MSQNKVVSDALANLEKLAAAAAVDNELVAMCKSAGVNDEDAAFVEKFARSFEYATSLSTEELVKRALQRFADKRDPDAVFRGISSVARDDRTKCAAVCTLLSEQDVREDPEAAAMLAALEKSAVNPTAIVKQLPRVFSGAASHAGPAVRQLRPTGLATKLKWLAGGAAVPSAIYGGSKAYESYGPSSGYNKFMQQYGPILAKDFSRRGNVSALLQMMREMGGNVDPKMYDMLERAFAFRRNPWIPGYYGS